MLFVVVGATDTNVRRSTGVTTANSTNIRNTVELGDQLHSDVSFDQEQIGSKFQVILCLPLSHLGPAVGTALDNHWLGIGN